MCDDAHESMRNCVGPQLYDSIRIYEPLVHHGAVRCIQGAVKWCVCFQDVLHVPWCYVEIAQTLTVNSHENDLETKTGLTKSFWYH